MTEIEKWQDGAKTLVVAAVALGAAGIAGALLCGLIVFVLELLNVADPKTLEAFIAPVAAIAALIWGPIFFADHMREEARPNPFDNPKDPIIVSLLPLERLWQRQADLMGDLITTNTALANRLDPIDDDLAQRTTAYLRAKVVDLEEERELIQKFVDAGKE